MAEFIDKQEFLEEQRHLYCENCEKRKGMKRGKMQFVYGIGDAPCRSCGYGDVLDDLEDFPAADVRPVARGKWELSDDLCWHTCSECGADIDVSVGLLCYVDNEEVCTHNFCPNCGADMREES